MIVKLYRKYIPPTLRAKIYDAFLGKTLFNLRNISSWCNGIWVYVFSPFYPRNDYYDAFRFVGRHGVTFYPFKTSVRYKHADIKVFSENRGGVFRMCITTEKNCISPASGIICV
jgi:hypothetical protein